MNVSFDVYGRTPEELNSKAVAVLNDFAGWTSDFSFTIDASSDDRDSMTGEVLLWRGAVTATVLEREFPADTAP
jgi:hypothetical protein